MLEKKSPARALAVVGLMVVSGCGTTAAFPLVGTWVDPFATTHTITEDTWTMAGDGMEPAVYHLLSFDLDAGLVTAENDAANAYDAGTFSQFDWSVDGDTVFCQVKFDAATEADAAAFEPADASDLETGCNGFPWSALTPAE